MIFSYYFRCCWDVVSEDDCEDRDNRQPRHEARGQCMSAGQVRPPHYQHGRQWMISLRGIYNNLLVWGHHLVLSACDILRYSFIIFVNLYGQFLPIFSSNTYFLIWNTLKTMTMIYDDSNYLKCLSKASPHCSQLFTRQEVVVLPPLVHPLIFCRSFLGSLHPSLRCSLL